MSGENVYGDSRFVGFFNFSRFWVMGGVEDDRQSLTSEQSSRAIKQSQRSSVSNKRCQVIIAGQLSVTDTFLYTKYRITIELKK